jgi:hypothetical protein
MKEGGSHSLCSNGRKQVVTGKAHLLQRSLSPGQPTEINGHVARDAVEWSNLSRRADQSDASRPRGSERLYLFKPVTG